MSAELGDPSSGQVDRKRRMSLKGPPLRVAMKQTAAAAPAPTAPAPRAVTQQTSLVNRRQSLSARQAAKPVVAKVSSATVSSQAVATTTADPFQLVNARLDAMERQIAELQSVVGRIAMVEEFLRPIKPALAQMQVDCSDLGELVKKLQTQADQHERQLNARLNMDEVPVGAEYEAEAIDVLNASLESGEIDIDQYATSLRIALNSEARKDSPNHLQNASYDLDSPVQTSHIRPVPHLSHHAPQPNFRPVMIPNTSTPPPHQLVKKMPLNSSVPSSTFVQPHYAPQAAASKPFIRQADTRTIVDTAEVKAPIVEVESPIPIRKDAVLPTTTRTTPALVSQATPKDQPTSHQLPTSGSFSTQKMRAVEIPAQTENRNPLANSLNSLTSTSIQSRKKPLADVPSSLADSDNIFQMMEPIMKEERENVKFWLGMDMPELNRAISIMNEFATTQRFEMTSFKEFYITVDDVAAQCNLDAKKAKAAVLLLCNFKRLKLVRGEINSYSLLSGNTLVK